MKLEVRRAEAADIPGIVEVWAEFMDLLKRTNPHYWKVRNGRSAFTGYLEGILAQKESLVAVGESDHRLLGFCLAHLDPLPEWFGSARIGLIRYLAVSEAAQDKGVGYRIATFVQDWFASQGVKRIELYVLRGLPASGFWEKIGYKVFMDRMFLKIK